MQDENMSTCLKEIKNEVHRDLLLGRIKVKEIEAREGKEHAKTISETLKQVAVQDYAEVNGATATWTDYLVTKSMSKAILDPNFDFKKLNEMQKVIDNDTEINRGMIVNLNMMQDMGD